jgi:hypothetical protein
MRVSTKSSQKKIKNKIQTNMTQRIIISIISLLIVYKILKNSIGWKKRRINLFVSYISLPEKRQNHTTVSFSVMLLLLPPPLPYQRTWLNKYSNWIRAFVISARVLPREFDWHYVHSNFHFNCVYACVCLFQLKQIFW